MTLLERLQNIVDAWHNWPELERRETAIGWQPDESFVEDATIPEEKPREFYRVTQVGKAASE